MTRQLVSVEPGVYQFRGILGKRGEDGTERWAFPPAEVVLIGYGRHVSTHQPQVAYTLGGELYFCGLAHWGEHFEPIKPEVTVTEFKTAGAHEKGPGV